MHTLLPLLNKPSRYTGLEEGSVQKNPAEIKLRTALAFPDTYEVGMSYLGQKILYGIINSHKDWWAERVVAPESSDGETLRRNACFLSTLESSTPLKELHCLGFSVTHELCFTNILYMLELGGIPLRSASRGDSLFDCPIVICGGGALLGAEPLAPFIDIMVLGDGEETTVDLLNLLQKERENQQNRRHFLEEARHIPGVYVPSFFTEQNDGSVTPVFADYAHPSRRIVADLNKAPYPVSQVVPFGAVHNRLSLEIARGCTRGCRFCHAGMVYRPVRERSLDNLQSLLDMCLKKTGFDDVSYLALSTGDFSTLKGLCNNTFERCSKEQITISLPSLRVGSVDDTIIEQIAGIRRTGATLAPEAGSQRLRDVINKGITEEQLILHIQKLIEHGWQQVKLYFMIGLPTETDEDLDAIIEICRKARDAGGIGSPRIQVTAAISPFVPKPFTPFQWAAQISLQEIERRVSYLRNAIKKHKCLKLRWHEPAMSHLEGIFSRGDRRLADVLEKAYHKGAIFSSWPDQFSLTPWEEAMKECGLSADYYIGARSEDAPLPWEHLESGIAPSFLKKEWKKALKASVSTDCRYDKCLQCGVCDRKNAPSLLAKGSQEDTICNRLNAPQRDQSAHIPTVSKDGRVICRPRTAMPPKIDSALTIKAAHYRITHTKKDGSAYFSQLEIQTLLERAMRKARLPLTFSQGFHPLPLVSFGRALPVGVSSQAEWFSLTLREALNPETVAQMLNPHMPKGMDIVSVIFVEKSIRNVQSVKETFILRCIGSETEKQKILQNWNNFSEAQSFQWNRMTKKGLKIQDLRPILSDILIHADSVSFTADWTNCYFSPLSIALAISGEEMISKIHLEKTAQFF